jgi:hypothetical protein
LPARDYIRVAALYQGTSFTRAVLAPISKWF